MSLLPYFQSGWSFSFRELGDRHGERAPGSSGRSEREKGGKEAQPLGVTQRRVSALGFGFGFTVTFSSITRFLLSLLPHPCLVTCRGGMGTGQSISVVRNRERIPQLCRWRCALARESEARLDQKRIRARQSVLTHALVGDSVWVSAFRPPVARAGVRTLERLIPNPVVQ